MHEKVSPRGGCYPRRAGSREQACGEERHECICRESPGDILGYSHREKSRDGCHRARFYGLCHHVHAGKSENFSGPQDINAYARFLRKVGHLEVGYGQLLCKAAQKLQILVDDVDDSTNVKPSSAALLRKTAISRSRVRRSYSVALRSWKGVRWVSR
jgi:hypothetical protein